MSNNLLIKLIKKLVIKSNLTDDQKKIILATIKDKTIKAYDCKNNKGDILKAFIKK